MQATWEKGKYGLMSMGLTMWKNWRSFFDRYGAIKALMIESEVQTHDIDTSANHASTNTDMWAKSFQLRLSNTTLWTHFSYRYLYGPLPCCLVSFPCFVGGLGMRLLFAWSHIYLYILNKLANGREDLIRDCITDGSHTLWYAPVGLLGEVHGESCDVMWF